MLDLILGQSAECNGDNPGWWLSLLSASRFSFKELNLQTLWITWTMSSQSYFWGENIPKTSQCKITVIWTVSPQLYFWGENIPKTSQCSVLHSDSQSTVIFLRKNISKPANVVNFFYRYIFEEKYFKTSQWEFFISPLYFKENISKPANVRFYSPMLLRTIISKPANVVLYFSPLYFW